MTRLQLRFACEMMLSLVIGLVHISISETSQSFHFLMPQSGPWCSLHSAGCGIESGGAVLLCRGLLGSRASVHRSSRSVGNAKSEEETLEPIAFHAFQTKRVR